jgi:Glycosyl hydrolases family 2, sugar binding domain/Glycosyl hydrolases family 2, TIM barrel domain/Glycosyl hydrolases family 2
MPSSLPLSVSDSAQRLELEYGWQFYPDPTGRVQLEDLARIQEWRPARVGLSWNSQFEDLRDYLGAAWYRTSFEVARFSDPRHVLLKFGAVDYFCEVYCNGNLVGKHEGGYTPFSFDVTSAIRPGSNDLAVRVVDPPMDEQQNLSQFPEMMYNEIPHGKQNWYVQNGGIWQGVRLELCPAIYVERVDVTATASGEFVADVRLAGVGLLTVGNSDQPTRLRLTIYDNAVREVFVHEEPLAGGNRVQVRGSIRDPRLWGPDSPALYIAEAVIEGTVRYRRRVRFGFRSFEARDGKLYLNGKPFYAFAALDQDFYPETIHSPASVEIVRDMMLKARQLGVNVLRCHLKVAHPVYLDTADELGMLVWAELPSWSDCWFPCDHFSYKAAFRGEQMFDEMVARDWNHPCIVIQTIMNESWGINLKDPEQRAWLRNMFDKVKSRLSPLGRLVVDNSACEGNFHVKTDLEDFHTYYSMPDQWPQWSRFVAELASRPRWTFSPHGDAERTGREPIILSEFGNWGLPKLPADLPWWFHRNFGDREVTRPSGVLERFYEFKFDQLFADYNDFAEETQWHQFISLKHEMESIRREAAIQGYVITGMTDVHWEANGLLDMWRNPKVYADELRALQQPDLLLCDFKRWNYRASERVEADVLLSHYSQRELKGARVRWTTDSGASGSFDIPASIDPGTVARVGRISFDVPQLDAARAERITLTVRTPNGARVAENSYDLFLFPALREVAGPLSFSDPLGVATGLRDALTARGYDVSDGSGRTDLAISTQLDQATSAHVASGGTAIVLIGDARALPADSGISVLQRAGNELDGRWFSNYNWVRGDAAPFSALAFRRVLGFESEHVAPQYVMQNVPASDFDDVLSGATYAWLNLNSALLLHARYGAGRLLLCTYRFAQYGCDPYATDLLDSMIRYTRDGSFDPRLTLSAAPATTRA